MLRVLMLATYFPRPGNRALGNWALSQAQALQRQGLEIRVVSLNPWVPKAIAARGGAAYAQCPPYVSWDGLPVWYPHVLWYPIHPIKEFEFKSPLLPMTAAWITSAKFLCHFTEAFKPHVIYAHHTAVNGYLAYRLFRRFNIPYLITDHDFAEVSDCANLPNRKKHFELVIGSASRMIAVASRMEKEMNAIFPMARTCTVWNGTDPIPASIRQKLRPPTLDGKTVLFSCGAFYRRKGFPLLIEAFARVANRFPNAVLRIAGDGEDKQSIESAIREHHLQERVELLGFQSHEAVLAEMCLCDAFILLGWDEPFATVFTEALSAGKPIVCAADGGIADVITPNVHGLVVAPRDIDAATAALTELLSSASLRERLGKAAGELFERSLKWDHNALRMKGLFEEAAANGYSMKV